MSVGRLLLFTKPAVFHQINPTTGVKVAGFTAVAITMIDFLYNWVRCSGIESWDTSRPYHGNTLELGIKSTGRQEHNSTDLQEYNSSVFKEYNSTVFQEYNSTVFQEYNSTVFQEYNSTVFQEYNSTVFQEYNLSLIHI